MAGTIDGPRRRGRVGEGERKRGRATDRGVVAIAVTVTGKGGQFGVAWTMTKKANAVVAAHSAG